MIFLWVVMAASVLWFPSSTPSGKRLRPNFVLTLSRPPQADPQNEESKENQTRCEIRLRRTRLGFIIRACIDHKHFSHNLCLLIFNKRFRQQLYLLLPGGGIISIPQLMITGIHKQAFYSFWSVTVFLE